MADKSTFYGMSRDTISAETRAQQLDRALNWIHENIATHLDVAALAQHSNMTASTMYRHFQASCGMTPIQYQRRLRMEVARRLLLTERLDIPAVRSRIGYYRPLEFVRDYRRWYGRSPTADVEQGRGVGGCGGARS